MFPSDLTDDPLLARSDKLIRWGAFTPAFGFVVIALTGWLMDPSRGTFIREMLVLGALGQVQVWLGMEGLRRARGWAFPGVLFYIWMGGIMAACAIASTAVVVLVPVPLLAPIAASWATLRMRWKKAR